MPFTYSGAVMTGRDYVRYLLGDTVEANAVLEDHEIDAALTRFTGESRSASFLARGLATRFAAEGNISVDVIKVENLAKAQFYSTLADELASGQSALGPNASAYAAASFGGTSIAARDALEDDSDRVAPAFKRGQFDRT